MATRTLRRFPVGDPQRVELGPDAIPALRIAPDIPGDPRRYPCLILQHGYGADKYDLEPVAEALASAGVVVFLPDAWGHGERFDPRGQNFMNSGTADYFISVVQHVMADLTQLIPVVRQDSLADGATVILGGFSLGGIAAILTAEEVLAVNGLLTFAGGVSIATVLSPLGMPLHNPALGDWARAHDMSLPQRVGALPPRPVLCLHGQSDDRLPLAGALTFYDAVTTAYHAGPELLEVAILPGTHQITSAMLDKALGWLSQWQLVEQA